VATNCKVVPTSKVALAGEMAMDRNVGSGAVVAVEVGVVLLPPPQAANNNSKHCAKILAQIAFMAFQSVWEPRLMRASVTTKYLV
jgi:hypothetical protein